MDKLKKYFLKIDKQFIEKKPFFLRTIGRWKRSHKVLLYKQARLLFNEALQCEKEIITALSGEAWKENRAFLKVKINAFEGLCNELFSMTSSTWKRWLEAIVIVSIIVFVLRTFFFGVYHVPTSSAETTLLVGDRVWGNKSIYLFANPKVGDMVMFQDPIFSYKDSNFLQRLWQNYIGVSMPSLKLKGGPRSMAKRIIAVPGDIIEGRVEDGRPVVYRNGKRIHEAYVNTLPLLAIKKSIGFFTQEKLFSVTIPDIFRRKQKIVLYSYNPKKDFEEQSFYYIDYQSVLYDRQNRYMKIYKSGVPSVNKKGRVIDVFGPYIVPKRKYWVMGDNRRNSIDSREWGFVDKHHILGRASFIIWSLDSEETFWLFELIKNPIHFFRVLRFGRFFKEIK